MVGGGRVALRKVRTLLDCDANIKVISPDPCPELAELAERGRIKILTRQYQPGDLQKAFLAIAATDSNNVNHLVMKEAKEKQVLVNIADDPKNSDFIIPSCLRRGFLSIAISTAGKSPALARKIRLRLEKEFGDEYASLVSLFGEVRTELRKKGMRPSPQEWQKAIDLEQMVKLLKNGEEKKAKAVLVKNLTGRGQ